MHNRSPGRAGRDPLYLEMIARLRAARRSREISQSKLAEVLGVNQAFVSKVETGERRLDTIEYARWCRALGIPLETAIPDVLRTVGPASEEN